jgi:hypothetical protein
MLARFLRSGWGVFLLTLVILILGAGSMVGYQIYSVAHPPRVKDPVAPGDSAPARRRRVVSEHRRCDALRLAGARRSGRPGHRPLSRPRRVEGDFSRRGHSPAEDGLQPADDRLSRARQQRRER